MAERLIVPRILTRGAGCLALMLHWHSAAVVAAELLPDPTRPPAEASMEAGPVPTTGPVLQSVLISPSGRIAVIGGQSLQEGDLYGDAKLVKISGSEVVLSGPGGEQTLKLFPGVEKTLHVAKPAVPEASLKSVKKQPNRSTERKEP